MSALSKLLVTEAHRRKVHEKKGRRKTPLVMNVMANPDIERVAVTNSKGEVVITEPSEGGVLTGFFELGLPDEDAYMAVLIDALFVQGVETDAGNIAYLTGITAGDIGDVLGYFEAYGLSLARVFCSYQGYLHLYETDLLRHPEGGSSLGEMPTKEVVRGLETEYFMAGVIENKPVFYNEHLGPYIVFAAPPAFVGLMTRIDTHVSVSLHNYERGLVIVRVEDND